MALRHFCTAAPGPLEAFAVQFDSLLQTRARRKRPAMAS